MFSGEQNEDHNLRIINRLNVVIRESIESAGSRAEEAYVVQPGHSNGKVPLSN